MTESYSPLRPTRRLPRQPSLEQLRKQAKDLLAQYRDGDSNAVSEVRQFERAPERLTFTLNDAQRVLARAYGYASWAKLKAFVDGIHVARLIEVVQAGDIAQARVVLNARPELVHMDVNGGNEHRALHYAVLRRDAAMVKLLMEAGADARKGIYPHRDATSALTLAEERGYSEIAAIIKAEEQQRRLEMSCPNATVSPAQDQIHAAISHGDRETAIRLLNADKSLIQACDRDASTPLHIAAEENDKLLVDWLLERRADVRKHDANGFTPLDRAALSADPRNGNAKSFPEVAGRLLAHGAEMTIYSAVALADTTRVAELLKADRAALHRIRRNGGLLALAVNHGHLQIVRQLLDLGADVDERLMLEELEEPTLSWGYPLWYAALANRYDIAELLLDRGADPNANVYASGWPLRNAWGHADGRIKRLLLARGARPQPYMVSETHDVEEAKRLLEAHASEDLVNELAWSAADHGCPEILELALPHLKWPRVDSRWQWIMTQPIRGASADSSDNEGHFRCMAVLLRHGIDPNVSSFGQTILHYAAAGHGAVGDADRARFASMLLDHGARLDARDDLLQSTPLGWASRWGRIQVAELLIARGASVEEPDAAPWATPKAWAEKRKNGAIAAMLRRHEQPGAK